MISPRSVEISATAPLLQTETTILGQNITGQQTSQLPLGGQRVFSFLARLSPGVVPGEAGARDEAGGSFSANGVRSNGQNNFLLNGVDNNVNVTIHAGEAYGPESIAQAIHVCGAHRIGHGCRRC